MTDNTLEVLQDEIAHHPDLAQDPAALVRRIREHAGVISDVAVMDLLRRLRNETTGLGALETLLARPGVTDVVVNGPGAVFVDSGQGLQPVEVNLGDEEQVRRLATRLIIASGQRLDDAQPFADGRLHRDDGTSLRIHALLAPPAENGTCLSIRVLRQATTSLPDLVAGGTIPADIAELLRAMVAQRVSFVVIGGTGSGKTTLLSALLAQVPATERIVVIEDTAELKPQHPHVVTMVARRANAEGTGDITMSALLQQSLRMRPDRIVVGEIRGGEVVDLLAALNTGHDGGAGTLHANSIAEVPARMEALAALGGMGRDALHSQLAAAVDVVLCMKRDASGQRRLQQVGLLQGNPVSATVVWSADGGPQEGFEAFTERLGMGAAPRHALRDSETSEWDYPFYDEVVAGHAD
ncbi:TadA family conjugal transfer-associated ATPase [Corynebacterium incognita]|uniref:TadA family conjugal transfer-associated ATPase n=1 Tax=Corynebacterium incognita TaxID=2754725 RepID=A0A7G7CMF9_9CORY|nr:TadA family conjugal transfer-associated ATPase [Corynebacterium incognita]QNE88775.1 TadA family conjugal transfer-associated ATPase [Corynebacterium incognita]